AARQSLGDGGHKGRPYNQTQTRRGGPRGRPWAPRRAMICVYRGDAIKTSALYPIGENADNSAMQRNNRPGGCMPGMKLCAAAGVAAWIISGTAFAQVVAPQVPNVPIPPGVDAFNLSLDEVKKYSSTKNFELIGHSYFKIDQRTPWAKGQGRPGGEVGSGFNTVRVYDGIAYLGGYSLPPTLYHVVIADVHDPKNIQVL